MGFTTFGLGLTHSKQWNGDGLPSDRNIRIGVASCGGVSAVGFCS